jgi:hypothetical protein
MPQTQSSAYGNVDCCFQVEVSSFLIPQSSSLHPSPPESIVIACCHHCHLFICLLPSFVDCSFECQTESLLRPMASLSLLCRCNHRRCHRGPCNCLSRGGRRGQIVVMIIASPSSPATNRRAETCGEGPLIVSINAMVACGDGGLLLWGAGPQWLQPIV